MTARAKIPSLFLVPMWWPMERTLTVAATPERELFFLWFLIRFVSQINAILLHVQHGHFVHLLLIAAKYPQLSYSDVVDNGMVLDTV